MMTAYYNEIDEFAAQWLRNLIAAGLIAPGDVDTRSIADVRPDDLRGYRQCHFFAGIGGWSLALRLAGWPDDRPAWTGSCPCQPFSAAGKQRGVEDERHLWPEFRRLIDGVRPPVVFGEQVASAAGRAWLASVRSDLEALGYAVGAADLCAAGVGAPHIRQRLWFVADASGERRDGSENPAGPRRGHGAENRRDLSLMADADDTRLEGRRVGGCGRADEQPAGPGGVAGGLGNARSEGWRQVGADTGWSREGGRAQGLAERPVHERDGGAGFWSGADWLPCRDGKSRPVEPGIQPLAHGVSARVGKLRAAGNAIVPQVAAAFVRSSIEARRLQEMLR
jgi:DNA (cytosine-5)-methyltransferase 1